VELEEEVVYVRASKTEGEREKERVWCACMRDWRFIGATRGDGALSKTASIKSEKASGARERNGR